MLATNIVMHMLMHDFVYVYRISWRPRGSWARWGTRSNRHSRPYRFAWFPWGQRSSCELTVVPILISIILHTNHKTVQFSYFIRPLGFHLNLLYVMSPCFFPLTTTDKFLTVWCLLITTGRSSYLATRRQRFLRSVWSTWCSRAEGRTRWRPERRQRPTWFTWWWWPRRLWWSSRNTWQPRWGAAYLLVSFILR